MNPCAAVRENSKKMCMVLALACLALVVSLVSLPCVGAEEEQRPLWSYQTSVWVRSVSISSNGNYIAAGGHEPGYPYVGKIYLFSRGSSSPLWTYTTSKSVCFVSISSDGSYVAAGSDDGKVYLFSKYSSTPLWSYSIGRYARQVAISPDGNYIAAIRADPDTRRGKIYLFFRDSSTPLWSYELGAGGLTIEKTIAISHDGSSIAAVWGWYPNSKVYLFSRDNNTPLWTYTHGTFYSVSISSDGSYIAAAGGGGVYLFHRSDNTHEPYFGDKGVIHVSISSDGNYIVSGGGGLEYWVGEGPHIIADKVFLFSRETGRQLWSYQTSRGDSSLAISSDGRYIAIGTYDKKFHLFSRSDNIPLWSYTAGEITCSVSISSDGRYTAAGGADYKVYLFGGRPDSSPSLSSGSLFPASGTTGENFTYEVTYTDNDGDAPSYIKVYIDNVAHDMAKVSGTYSTGAKYRYTWATTSTDVGAHSYYFYASDGVSTTRLPPSGSYDGPTVKIQTTLTITPSSFNLVFNQPENFTATLTSNGNPLDNAVISWTAMYGSISPSSGTTDNEGKIRVIYLAPSKECTDTITASFAGDDQYVSNTNKIIGSVVFEVTLFFKRPDGTPIANTDVYYGKLENEIIIYLGKTDPQGRITTREKLGGQTIYLKTSDGKYVGSASISSVGGEVMSELSEVSEFPVILIIAAIILCGGATGAVILVKRRR